MRRFRGAAVFLVCVLFGFFPVNGGSQDETHESPAAEAEHGAELSTEATGDEHGSAGESHEAGEDHAAGTGEGHEAGEDHEDGHAGPWYKNLDLWKFLNLTILLAVLLHYVGGSMKSGLQNRTQTIRTELETAQETLEKAEKSLDDAEYRLATLHEEIEAMKNEGRTLADQDRARILSHAQTAADELKSRAQTQIQRETQAARRELRRYVADLIVDQVRQDLTQKVERDGEQAFIDSILNKVETLG